MFKKLKYRITVVTKILPFTTGIKKFFVLSFILSVFSMVLGFVNPIFYKIFIDDVILAGEFSKILIVISGYLGIFFIRVIIGYLKNYSNYTLINNTLYRVKLKIWKDLFKFPFSIYETQSVGDMKMRLDDDTGQIKNFAGYQTADYIINIITLIFSLVLLVIIDWRLSLFSVIIIPFTFWFDHIISKKEGVLKNSNRENDQKMSSWLHASVQSWREVKALNLEYYQRRRFIKFLHNYAIYFSKWINYWTARVLVIPKIKDQFIMQFSLYFIGGLLIINGDMKIVDLILFATYYAMLSGAVKSVSSMDSELQSNMPFTNRLMVQLEAKEAVDNNAGIYPDDSNIISLENVSFTYPKTKNEVLHNFSLIINKGERIALTGKSGCGKTTTLKLITGMITPTKGKVSFSGVDLKEINLEAMHKKIGFVMQENTLFNTSIRENLLYGKLEATDEELYEACEKAYILDFIRAQPKGFDTVIGEKGIKLSGGQRQRIVLARLFLRNVDVFIFDEATSALDQHSENIIQEAISNIATDKTIIVVAHRDSSMKLCDRRIQI